MIAEGVVTIAPLKICNAFSLSLDVKGVNSKFALLLVFSSSWSHCIAAYVGNKTLNAFHAYGFYNRGGAYLP